MVDDGGLGGYATMCSFLPLKLPRLNPAQLGDWQRVSERHKETNRANRVDCSQVYKTASIRISRRKRTFSGWRIFNGGPSPPVTSEGSPLHCPPDDPTLLFIAPESGNAGTAREPLHGELICLNLILYITQ